MISHKHEDKMERHNRLSICIKPQIHKHFTKLKSSNKNKSMINTDQNLIRLLSEYYLYNCHRD